MNAKVFDVLVTNRLNFCQKILSSKDKEYSSDTDRLHNFVVAGRMLDCTPIKALNGMKVKHSVSVGDIFNKMEADPLYCPTKQLVDDKITDVINYLLLAEGLIEDRRAAVEKQPQYLTVVCQKCGISMTNTAEHFENLKICPGCVNDSIPKPVPYDICLKCAQAIVAGYCGCNSEEKPVTWNVPKKMPKVPDLKETILGNPVMGGPITPDPAPDTPAYCPECHYAYGFHGVECSHKVKGPVGKKD